MGIKMTRQEKGPRRVINRVAKSSVKGRENIINLGTWNVRGTYEEGALKHLVEVMKKYKLDILALQETKQRDKVTMEVEGYMFFNSGVDNRNLGVGFLINSKLKKEVVEFEGFSDRVCKLRIRGQFRKLSLINVHAPSEEKEIETKVKFYEELNKIMEEIPKFDIKYVVGDMNAKIGREEEYRNVTGGKSKHSVTNGNGTRLVEFALENNMKIVSTMFDHKDIHKETWIAPNRKTKNQIDHVLIESRHSGNVMDVRSYRGADADSDHILVIAKMKQERPYKKRNKRGERRKYDLDKLKDAETAKNFKQQMEKELRSKAPEEQIEEEWSEIEKIMKDVTESVLGEPKRRRIKKWFDDECKQILENRNKARLKLMEANNDVNKRAFEESRKTAKRVCRAKKRGHVTQRLKGIEESYKNKEIRNFYQEIKRNGEQGSSKLCYIKDKEGLLLYDKGEKLSRFAQYFQETLNEYTEVEEESNYVSDEEQENEGENIIGDLPTKEEIEKCIMELKNNKSSGENSIPAEILKYGGNELRSRIGSIIKKVWEEEKIPERWNNALILPLLKKGAKEDCNNYRGIALLDVTYKVLSKIIRNRLYYYHNTQVGEYQGGFKAGRSTIDQIFTIKQLQQNTYEQNLSLHLLFIDFKQAYDSIKRKRVYEALKKLGIPGKLRRLVEMTLKKTVNRVTMEGDVSESFLVEKGLRQGDPLSTTLFNIVLEAVLRESGLRTGGLIYGSRHQCLAYADDIVLMTRSKRELERVFKLLVGKAREYGLEINESKTKYMVMKDNDCGENISLRINCAERNYTIQKVEQIDYLGVVLTCRGTEEEEIRKRIVKGSRAAGRFKQILLAKDISREAKIQLYLTVIRPTVTYACEAWIMKRGIAYELEVWERKILRRIYGGIKEDGEFRRRTNKEIEDLYNKPRITQIVRAQRLRWLGHIARMEDSRWVKRVLMSGEGGKKRRGRPRKKWLEEVKEDMRRIGVMNWTEEAKDRRKWRERVKELEAMGH